MRKPQNPDKCNDFYMLPVLPCYVILCNLIVVYFMLHCSMRGHTRMQTCVRAQHVDR